MNNTGKCLNCNQPINIMIFRNENYCSDLCRKALAQQQLTEQSNGGKGGRTKRR